MARRLTDTYFAKCTYSIRFVTNRQILKTTSSVGIYVIPEIESVGEYIKIVTERQVKHNYGNNCTIAHFSITEITPL